MKEVIVLEGLGDHFKTPNGEDPLEHSVLRAIKDLSMIDRDQFVLRETLDQNFQFVDLDPVLESLENKGLIRKDNLNQNSYCIVNN